MIVKAECCVPSCNEQEEGGMVFLLMQGWRGLKATLSVGKAAKWRTHLGWCPYCAKHFSVVEREEKQTT